MTRDPATKRIHNSFIFVRPMVPCIQKSCKRSCHINNFIDYQFVNTNKTMLHIFIHNFCFNCFTLSSSRFPENMKIEIWQPGATSCMLRTVPTIVTAHTFCASRDTRFSYQLVPTSTGIFLRGLKLYGESRT